MTTLIQGGPATNWATIALPPAIATAVRLARMQMREINWLCSSQRTVCTSFQSGSTRRDQRSQEPGDRRIDVGYESTMGSGRTNTKYNETNRLR
ncbi:hypothetical protein RB195_019818 [Necator americanus]|uniref:Uncharacterized protein n=1 Tax=Necator americanus TaxID=51031 RepID=A0ABR1CFX4_NECAM